MRLLFVWLGPATLALAQFAELAVTRDGSQLFFTTNYRQRGTEQTLDPKLFRMREGEPSLVRTQTCDSLLLTGACGITELQVSGDAAVATYQSVVPCRGGSSCIFRELGAATLLVAGERRVFGGRIRISRSGRYMFHHDTSGVPGAFARISRLHDLESGSVIEFGNDVRSHGSVVGVSDDATVLMSRGALLRTSGRTQLPLVYESYAIDMDARARFVLAQTRERRRLYVTEVVAGRTWQLGPDDRESYDAHISADGQWVLYLSVIGGTPQAFLSRPDGSNWRQLTVSDDGVQDLALSDDGRAAFLVTGGGSVLRIDTSAAAAAAEEIIGPTPRDLRLSAAPTPGSLITLTGFGLAAEQAAASPPLPEELAGTRVTLAGVPMLLHSTRPTEILFQVPWEAPVSGETSLVLSTGTEYFETSIPAWMATVSPRTLAIVHEDFGAVVTNDNPASAGEIVHLYTTGFGPVAPAVASGVPTPGGALSRVTTPWEFAWSSVFPPVPAEMLFAGLAPGMIGIYQLDIRVPSPAPRDGQLRARYLSFDSYFARVPVQQ